MQVPPSKVAKMVVTNISTRSAAVFDGNNSTSNNGDPCDATAPRSDNDDVQQDQEDNHSARSDIEVRIISSIREGEEIITKWKEGSGRFILDVPLDMPGQTAIDLMTFFRKMGASCLLEGPNLKSILGKELLSAQLDLEVASKIVAELQSLMSPPASTGTFKFLR
jgi:hypothetical protein